MHATGGLRNAYRLFAVQAADELRKPKLKTYDKQAGRHRDGVSGFAVFGREVSTRSAGERIIRMAASSRQPKL